MAKILMGALMVDMRGKVGGTVFSKNKGGAIARNKVTPVNPRTTSQQLVRARFGGYSASWRLLTNDQRDQWSQITDQYPRKNQFGNNFYLSAQQLFISFNSNVQKVDPGAAQLNIPGSPEGAGFTFLDEPFIVIDRATNTIALDLRSVVPSNGNVIASIKATAGFSAGISNPDNKLRYIGYTANLNGQSVTNITTPYKAVFGNLPAPGAKVWVEIEPVNSVTGEFGATYLMELVAP